MNGLVRTILRIHIRLYSLLVPMLVRLPLGTLLAVNDPPGWWRPYGGAPLPMIQSMVERCLAEPRLMRRRKCLRQGLVLHHFLRLAGYGSQLHFGVYSREDSQGKLHGHCWVCLDGQAVSPPPGEDSATVHVRNLQ